MIEKIKLFIGFGACPRFQNQDEGAFPYSKCVLFEKGIFVINKDLQKIINIL
jgi:hypothetical protein